MNTHLTTDNLQCGVRFSMININLFGYFGNYNVCEYLEFKCTPKLLAIKKGYIAVPFLLLQARWLINRALLSLLP
jgi:hypothetical protein